MKSTTIRVGKRNTIYQHIIVLKENRTKRFSSNEIFIEGVHNIKAALKHGWNVKHWIYSQGKLSDWAKSIIAEYKTTENYCFTNELIQEISDRTDKSELMAIFDMKRMRVELSENPFVLICDRISKKGNLGTIIRSADAFGCDGIIVTGHAVDIYDPEVIAASMGSFFAVNVEKIDNNNKLLEFIETAKQQYPNLKVVATTELGEYNLRDYNFCCPIILLIGNETFGLSKFYMDICDDTVKIPMVGEATSFNVANATSIFLYETFSQRKNN